LHFYVFASSSLMFLNTVHPGPSAVFTRRGVVTIQSVRAGMAEFIPESPLSEEEKVKLKVNRSQLLTVNLHIEHFYNFS